jgi:Uma2 family endonuclease
MSGTTLISLEHYHERYSGQRGYEYWFGEVVRKPVPTWLHSILQVLLGEIFTRAGYIAGSELDLRIDSEWEPRPDVAATLQPITEPYPTKPIELVAEVLSPDDALTKVRDKCSLYSRIGIAQIFVFDPEREQAWEWNQQRGDLERLSDRMTLQNGSDLILSELWSELERRVSRRTEGSA